MESQVAEWLLVSAFEGSRCILAARELELSSQQIMEASYKNVLDQFAFSTRIR